MCHDRLLYVYYCIKNREEKMDAIVPERRNFLIEFFLNLKLIQPNLIAVR